MRAHSRKLGAATVVVTLALVTSSHRASAQTFVQLQDLDPKNALGPRLTSVVTANKLSGNKLFGSLGAKITLIDAVASPPKVYEFASDATWDRVLFGEQDQYINQFKDTASALQLHGPGGLDVAATDDLFIADAFNSRVVLARFNPAAQTLTETATTDTSWALYDVADVAWDGGIAPLVSMAFYALNPKPVLSYWVRNFGGPNPGLAWTYGSRGSGTGQFLNPSGVCVGHSSGSDGGSVFTNEFYVADQGNKRVVWLERGTSGPTWKGSVTLPDSGVPVDCTVDHFGNVYVADVFNSRILKYSATLGYLDRYGSYGVGATNDNTFAHPHAIHAPFGTTKNWNGDTIWYGEGRILTAEDWGAQSGAREHYLGVSLTINPANADDFSAWFSYVTTDHGYHTVNVLNRWSHAHVKTLVGPSTFSPPGTYWVYWDGTDDNGNPVPQDDYFFGVDVLSGYGCSGGPDTWCEPNGATNYFTFPNCTPPNCPMGPSPVASDSIAGAPTTVFLRQHVVAGAVPLSRVSGLDATAPPGLPSLSELIAQFGIRNVIFGVTTAAAVNPVTIRVYSMSGRLIRTLVNQRLDAGTYVVGWDGLDERGRPAGPGIYLAMMTIGSFRGAERLILRQP